MLANKNESNAESCIKDDEDSKLTTTQGEGCLDAPTAATETTETGYNTRARSAKNNTTRKNAKERTINYKTLVAEKDKEIESLKSEARRQVEDRDKVIEKLNQEIRRLRAELTAAKNSNGKTDTVERQQHEE